MGTLPPNIAVEDLARWPAARVVTLTRTAIYGGAGFTGAIPSAVPTPFYTGVSRVGTGGAVPDFWDTIVYDYSQSSARGNVTSGTGPYVERNAGSGIITVTAPYHRPLPVLAWARLIMHTDPAGGHRMGIVRSLPQSQTLDYRIVAEQFSSGTIVGFQQHNCFGFDLVPAGLTYHYWVGVDGSVTSTLFYAPDATYDYTGRNEFGVITL